VKDGRAEWRARGEFDGIGNTRNDVGRLQESRSVTFGEEFIQELAVNLLEREVTDAIDVAGVEDRDDVRVVQLAGRLRLAHEGLFHPFVRGAILALGRMQLHGFDDQLRFRTGSKAR